MKTKRWVLVDVGPDCLPMLGRDLVSPCYARTWRTWIIGYLREDRQAWLRHQGGNGVSRERRTRTAMRHLDRRAKRARRRVIRAALAENRLPPGVYDFAGLSLTATTTACDLYRRRL